MEEIAKLKEVAVPLILEPTVGAFSKLLEKNRSTIEAVPKRTFSFGPAPRNQVDIYYPSLPAGTTAPVLVFIYGGGFISGERVYPAPLLAYTNIGAYFARRGFFVAIPDYTLLPGPSFPLPPTDVRDAIAWIATHSDEISTGVPDGAKPDARAIHAIGHSAGATHLATAFLLPELAQGPAYDATATVILSGPALFRLKVGPDMQGALDDYYGGEELFTARLPPGLLESASDDQLRSLPRVVLVQAEREFEGVQEHLIKFKEALQRRMTQVGGGKGGWHEVKHITGKGHNHISINWALSAGEGEEWAEELIALIKSS